VTWAIRELTELAELREVAELFAEVWARPGEPPISSDVLRAMSHSGNYIAGAGAGGRLIGGIAGWIGMHEPGGLHVHSHILGVLPGDEAKGLGFALKQHQRTWCLERGIDAVEWTFDPLVRRNAYFNFTKLGAEAAHYLVDFYGQMADGINAGDESDRILIRWDLRSEKATAAAAGRAAAPELADEMPRALAIARSGEPEMHDFDAAAIRVQVPEDIVAIRRSDSALAQRWRHAVRHVLGGALARDYRITAATRDGWYVLRRS
jgi:predicted GNAT superfamily acetyltransferase